MSLRAACDLSIYIHTCSGEKKLLTSSEQSKPHQQKQKNSDIRIKIAPFTCLNSPELSGASAKTVRIAPVLEAEGSVLILQSYSTALVKPKC